MVQMRQIDPGAENPAAARFGMIDGAAAQHGDFGCGIENRDVDCGFHRIDGCLVLRVQEPLVARGQEYRVAAPLDAGFAEIEPAFAAELVEQRRALRARHQRRVTKVPAGAFVGQDVRQENSLVDLKAVLVALEEPVFGCNRLLRRRQTGHRIGRGENQLFELHEPRAALSQQVVDRADMGTQKTLALASCGRENRGGCRGLGVVAARLRRELTEQFVRAGPILRPARSIALVIARFPGLRRRPGCDRGRVEACRQCRFRGRCLAAYHAAPLRSRNPLMPSVAGRPRAWLCPASVRWFRGRRPEPSS